MDEEKGILPTGEYYTPHMNRYREVYERSLREPEKFWSEQAQVLDWFRTWDRVLDDSNPPFYRWFVNGKLNVSYNCLDRHLKQHRRNKAAYIWVAENGEEKIVTYDGLYRRVNNFARALQDLGIRRGDRVVIYLPMILEAPVAMLACARIGAVFSFVFAGFGAQALADRIKDSEATMVITADGGFRNGKIVELKKTVDEALEMTSTVRTVVVVKRTGHEVNMEEGRDVWWHDVVKDGMNYVEPEWMDANDPLFILYTSGTTGKPKGALHGNGGYSVWVANTLRWAFDPQEDDRWWCAADIGWITGHSYIVFAPLILGLTSIMYEGSITYPAPDRLWEIVERYRVNILYTSPTAIRTLMRYGEKYPKMHDLSSLKTLGTVGEPINPAAWKWYYENIGGSRCPIIDTYWQTETGGFMISPQLGLGLVPLKPGSATFPMPGVDPVVVDESGRELPPEQKGYIIYRRPWPGMFLTLYRDPERFKKVYFERFPGNYFCGDYCVKDKDGYYWLLGRADEVLNVSGHRLGTIEVEDALISYKEVAEAAVFGRPDPVKGEVIVAFVVIKDEFAHDRDVVQRIRKRIREDLGPIYVPEEIHVVTKLPKTRSGKIMRRVVKAVALGQLPGDISTLEDSASVEEIKTAIEEFRRQAQSAS
ncbi:acetyl-coenzyme A synthetase [Thermogymnomonas acidicola]|uniref:Acetate--CoA ligase n=1 Tax=Thermogymnomonas acidicola TaxID=399579 RepID=A0AA37BRQ8_9ARCH|nr:acetate--CoA ligase [Thermogymnomonas acidicola]GGM75349.1 acetyl-coenzyme A synthetase [Thermogymnomonas acidicola]